jgi:ectoine hydroxylase-related dioxygenase (phytanoyl-CoA dioxygenase family)
MLRRELEERGFAVVEGALAPEHVARLREAVDRVRAREGTNGAALHRLGFVGLDDAFVELLDHPATFPLVADVLGWNVYMYHCHLDVHPPAPDAAPQWRWHQDGGRQNVELASPRPRLSLKIAYFLTDVPTAEHGALKVLPGSHTTDTLPRDGEPPEAVPLLVRAGTAVVLDRRLWHARGDNRSQATRIALFYAYTYRWIRPRDELGLDPRLLERLGPVKRQLLGAGTSAIGYWIPTDEDVPLRARAPTR